MQGFRQPWLGAAIGLGIGYAVVGLAFATPVTHVQAWRLAAWGVSAMGFAAHIAYERFRLRNAPARAACHVALAVALGAFALAVVANIHSLFVESSSKHRPLLLLSLALWPVVTAVPAFVIALVVSSLLKSLSRLGPR